MSSYNEQCPKCHIGLMTEARYVVASSETKPPDTYCLSTCPSEEHIHLRCAVCGYFEAKPVQS